MAAKKRAEKKATGSKETKPAPPPVSAPQPSEESLTTLADAAPAESTPESSGPPVAGIGASAGGLDAFKKLLAAMPPDSGVAFVLVPHLDPAHESLMVELLARHTTMPVVEAENNMPVEANHVYIIPPNKYMTIHRGVLRLTGPVERRAAQTSIDLFLRSLADDQQERSICIILSGTGSHGTLGLKAVKAAGGITMVQDPSTAEYERMPQSAIATGLVDFVLPVEQMPDALVNYVHHAYVNGGVPIEAAPQGADHLTQVLALLRARTRFDFRCYRKKMLTRRIERRMMLNQLDSLHEYVAYLRDHPDELKQLVKDLFITVTSFFHDPEAFEQLATKVMALLVQRKEADSVIRVWVPGCATGEEPYSIAMLLQEQLAAHRNCRVQIFATDVDEEALETARHGLYPDTIAGDVSPERLARFFTKVDDHTYQINKPLRETVIFAVQNLVSDAPFTKLDLICCRNLLIYLEPEVQKKVITLFHFALVEGGFLFMGSSETIGRQVDLFEPLVKKWRIYRRIGPARPERVDFPIVATTEGRGLGRRPAEAVGGQPINFAEVTQRLLLDQYAPAAVLINRTYEIFYFFGPCSKYLELPAGEPTRDLMLMARDALATKLRGAVHRAIRENETVVVKGARVKRDGAYCPVRATVRPVHVPKTAEGLLLITFEDEAPPAQAPAPPSHPGHGDAGDESTLRQLEYELKATREDLQSTIEEMESSNEELKAFNEEVMSMNEELQSANEELETSKEELQSLNEELSTVNNQLQEKVAELEVTNNDMTNLLNSTDVATVFLDAAFRIKRFTPAATKLFNLIASDAGRPLSDINPRFSDPDLLGDAQQVLQRLVPQEKEVTTVDGIWWSRRLMPYRTQDNRIEGVVITFVDITERKQAADAVVRRLASIVESSADAIISKDLDGTIRTWNQGAERLYGYTQDEAVGQSIKLIVPEDRADQLAMIMKRLRRGENVQQLETERVRKDGQRVPVALTASPVRDSSGKVVSASAIAHDISERKRGEEALRASERSLAAELAGMARLQEVSTRLVQSSDPTSLLLEIVDAAIALTAADMGNIQLLDPNFGTLKIVASRGFECPFLEFFNTVHEGQTSCGTAMQKVERVVIEDVTTSSVFAGTPALDVLLSAGVRAVESTPLVSRSGRLVGMLSTHYRAPHRPADRDLHVLDLLARQAADWMERTQAETALHDREDRLQAILNTAADAIITIDHHGIIQSVNAATEQMFGYTTAEMIGQSVNMLMPSPYREAHDEYIARYVETGEKHIIGISREVEAQRKDGGVFPADLAVTEIKHLKLFTGIHRDLTERKRLEREVVEVASQQQQHIGQNLHDTVAQELTALSILTRDLAGTLRTNPAKAAPLVERIDQGLQRSQQELRTVLRGLLPVAIDSEGLMAALTDLADRTQREGKVTCTFDCPEPVSVADNLISTHLYLIAQEAVHNALKHAQPRNIGISLESNQQLVLRVQDDGLGMPAQPPANKGLGLRIMRNRAEIIGATLTVGPAEPAGTVVTCALTRRTHEPEKR
jgi:two-component system CheB/CheR fusion protein